MSLACLVLMVLLLAAAWAEPAVASFDRGNGVAAVNQLNAFINKVRAQVATDNPAKATEIIHLAQEVTSSVVCSEDNGDGR